MEWFESCGSDGFVPLMNTGLGKTTTGIEYKTMGSSQSPVKATVPFGGMLKEAPKIQLNYRAQDVGSSTASAAQTSSNDSNSTGSPPSSSSRLSGGAIGGIVVGIVVALAGIGFLFFFLGKKRNKKGTPETTQDDAPASPDGGTKSTVGEGTTGKTGESNSYHKPELVGSAVKEDTANRAELEPQQQYLVELAGDVGLRAELDGQT